MAKVKIEMTGPSQGKVYVDGVEQAQVVAVKFEVDVRSPRRQVSTVEITQLHLGADVEIQGEIDVTKLANDGTRRFANG